MNEKKAGVIISYLSQGIHILSSLLYTPVMLRLMGQSEYGLYQLVYSVVSYLGLLSFGFSSSYMRFWSRCKVKNDEEEIARLNGMFMTIFFCIAGICVLCGLVMVGNIEFIFSDGLTTEEYPTARILLILMVINLALTFPNSVFDAITSAHEKFVFQKTLLTLQYLFNPFLTLPLLIMGYGSIAMVVVTTFLTLAKLAVNGWFCIVKLKTRFWFRGFRWGLLKEMWIFTFYIFINMIVDQINWSMDKFLLGRFSGTTAVAVYGVGGQINAMYKQLSTSVSAVFIPRVNCIVAGSDDNKQLTALLTKVGRIQFVILALVLSAFVFLGEPFIAMWAGKGYEHSYTIALLLMVPVTIPLIQNVGIEIQRAKNKHKARSIVYLLIAIANLFISIPCIKIWGARGAAIGTAVTLFAGNGLFMNWYYDRHIGLDMKYYWKQIIKFIPFLILPCIMGIFIMKFCLISSFLSFCIVSLAYAAVYCISIWFWGLNTEEKKMITAPVKQMQRRFAKK